MLKRGSPSSSPSSWPTLGHLILAAGIAIALISAPISLAPDSLEITWQSAHGKHGERAAPYDHGGLGIAKG